MNLRNCSLAFVQALSHLAKPVSEVPPLFVRDGVPLEECDRISYSRTKLICQIVYDTDVRHYHPYQGIFLGIELPGQHLPHKSHSSLRPIMTTVSTLCFRVSSTTVYSAPFARSMPFGPAGYPQLWTGDFSLLRRGAKLMTCGDSLLDKLPMSISGTVIECYPFHVLISVPFSLVPSLEYLKPLKASGSS